MSFNPNYFILQTTLFEEEIITPESAVKDIDTPVADQTGHVSVQKSSEKSVQKIIVLIKENANITTQEIADKLGINRSGVARHMKNLQKQCIIRRVGPDKGGHWEIVEE